MSENNFTAWVDLVSPAHPFFFNGLLQEFQEMSTEITVRKKTETVDLAETVGFDYQVLGRDFDNTLLRKFGIPLRTLQLSTMAPQADISLSSRNAMCILASKMRGVASIHFTDNDITAHVEGLRMEKLYNRLEAQASYNIVPEAFEIKELTRWGADPERIYTYEGYKEDIYVAGFEPDDSFTDQLPFENYIVIRPEALDAAYVNAECSIVPDLLEWAEDDCLNVVYLPRGRGDREYANPYNSNRVFIPDSALDGLQLAWHSDGVLTGSGTMAREAACMAKPAVSFFPNTMLSVDQDMASKDLLLHSRSVPEICQYLQEVQETDLEDSLRRSKFVRKQVADIVADLTAEVNDS